MKKGLLIAFDGIDGCGKTTQAWKLGKYLSGLSKHNHIVMTREPYKDMEIRRILREEENPYSQAKRLAQKFVADRILHNYELIAPNLSNGSHVISDRYSFSTFAFQRAQGIKLKELVEMHKGVLIPDIIFVVDLPVKDAQKRMKIDTKRKTEQKFEKNIKFMEKVRQNYLELARLKNHRVIIINGKPSAEKIFEKQIKPVLDKVYNTRLSS